MSTVRFPHSTPESESFISAVIGHFTPDVVHSASSMIGESESSTRRALQTAAPTVLGGLTNMVSSREGQNNLATMIRDGGYSGLSENPMSMFRGGSATNYIISGGERILGKVFGNNVSSVVEEVGKSSGVGTSSANKLLALTAPLTLGVLGKRASAQGLGTSGLADKLLGQKAEIANAAPVGLSRILGFGPRAVSSVDRTTEHDVAADSPVHIEHFTEPAPTVVERRPEARVSEPAISETRVAEPRLAESRRVTLESRPERPGALRWLPFALLLLAAIALLGYLLRPRPRIGMIATHGITTARNALANITLPGGVNLSVPQGSMNYNLARFLGDTSAADLPRTFVFDRLNFVSDSTQLTPESGRTVTDLAQVLRAYPHARIQLIGNTDNTGTRAANQTLSENRANAVKAMLVSQGVSADRISTIGRGQDNPVAGNDTELGRAQNRRIELNVVQK